MSTTFAKRLARIESADAGALAGGRKGVEKEALRIAPDGTLALTPHPITLGSALTNRFITTDFSEALLEFVTPAYASTWEALKDLSDIHQFTYAALGDESLWPASMPCRVPENTEIPLAQYGSSNVGRMKTIYRRGLGYRYGRAMQTIAGVHYNYSLPVSFWPLYRDAVGAAGSTDDFRSEQYLGLVRNFRRFGWLVLYLFGASPAVCRSFEAAAALEMSSLREDTLYAPYATSLRMSDLGYSNKTQAGIKLSLNSIDEYVAALTAAINTVEPRYCEIGVKVDGERRQLNANVLQIENEYYSSVRPKRVARSGERPTAALQRGGIEYVEIRSLDIGMFDPAGINQNTMRFIEAFLVYCLLEESPPLDDEDLARATHNQSLVAKEGRRPGLKLSRQIGPMTVTDWGREMIDKVKAVAALIDAGEGGSDYSAAVDAMRRRVEEPGETPSARLLDELTSGSDGYFDYVLGLANTHREYFGALEPLSGERLLMLENEARESIERQRAIEAADELSLDEYLDRYYASGPGCP